MTPTYHKGEDLFFWWSDESDDALLVVTTNSFVKRDGTLVMGRGAAKTLANRFPWIPTAAGEALIRRGRPSLYGFMTVMDEQTGIRVGLFQVKYHWREYADPTLIGYSAAMLREYVGDVAMNFPGIGNGGLDPSIVRPILDTLPHNVHIFQH